MTRALLSGDSMRRRAAPTVDATPRSRRTHAMSAVGTSVVVAAAAPPLAGPLEDPEAHARLSAAGADHLRVLVRPEGLVDSNTVSATYQGRGLTILTV